MEKRHETMALESAARAAGGVFAVGSGIHEATVRLKAKREA